MAGDNQQFCLRWNNHQSTLISVFDSLLESGTLVDCTLAAEGQYLKAHKVVLSACSPYLELLLSQHYEKHPIVILKDVKFQELKSMMDYMYRGEVNITQDQLATFLKAAESLQIKGLSESSGSTDDARDVGSTAKRPREEPPPRRPVPPHPQARLPHSSGLTIEPRRSIPHSSEMAPASPMKSREGSTSPVARKRRRRRPSGGDDASNAALSDSQLDTSNSCDLPPVSNQAQSTPISVPSILATPSASNNQSESDQPLETEALSRFPNTTGSELMVKTKMEPNTDQLIEPKTEYLEDINNEDSVEDLTLDDDDEMPGPSHADGSNQNFSQWQMAGDRSTDEVFMAAQEAVGAHRDSQDSKVIFKQFLVLLKRLQKTADQNSTSLENLNVKVDRLLPHEDVGTELTDDSLDEYLRRALPIKSMEEFDSLQEDLKSNSLLRNKLCSILVLAVGKEVKDTCQNMLRKLIIDEVAQKFTYKGKLAGKARFADTEISDLLNDSIRSVYPATDDKIKEFVSEWLTQAKFRVQKREKRKKNTEVQPCIELNLGDSVDQANQNSLNFQSVLEQLRVVSEESLRMEPLQ